VLHPEWAKTLVEILEKDKSVQLAYSNVAWIDETGEIYKQTNGGDFMRSESSSLDRITACLDHRWGECTAVNGIFRCPVFRGFWYPKCSSPDHIILARASYLGKIDRSNRLLYFRRETRKATDYYERIKPKGVWGPSKDVSATISAHIIDYIVLRGLKPSTPHEVKRLLPHILAGYSLTRHKCSTWMYFRISLWLVYFAGILALKSTSPNLSGWLPRGGKT
jgi:hypothetical protein